MIRGYYRDRALPMPLTITVDVTCDGCGRELVAPREVKQNAIDRLRWDSTRRFTTLVRTRRPTQFYCVDCADRAAPKTAHRDCA